MSADNKITRRTWLRDSTLADGSVEEGVIEMTVSEPFVNSGIIAVVHARQIGMGEANQAAAETWGNTS